LSPAIPATERAGRLRQADPARDAAYDAGIEVLRRPRDYIAVRQALAQAGYNGEKIVVIALTDVQSFRALSLAGTDQLRRAGMNVDLQEMELAASNP
jgi:peptide/nickel transport system substrate-binding protein